jgi:ATP-dependent DNA helicase PIF1
VNLGEGTTINTLLRYYDTSSLREAYTGGYLESILKKHRALGLERILLDEVSMMCAEQLDIITHAIDNVNQDKQEGVPDLGLILCGDHCQLPPVPDRDPADPTGRKKLAVRFAFEAESWERYQANTLKLTRIRRQADAEFIEALQAVRRGAVGQALEYFGPRLVTSTDMAFPGPTIVAKNDAVSRFNQLRMDQVRGAVVAFPSSRWGKLRPEWGGPPKPEHDWGIPPVLQLKEGCRVMILANKNVGGKDQPPVWAYTNGDLGTFVGKGLAEQAVVRLDRTGTEVNVGMLDRANEIPMEPGRRKALREAGHPERIVRDGKAEAIGGITYLPLRVCYATTCHKSQGLSLDRVQLVLRDPFWQQPALMYVGLSRARSVEGLRLVGTPEGFRLRCTVSPMVKEYL